MKNYKLLTENLKRRINPDNIILQKSFSDELGTIAYSDVLTFVRLAMKGVEQEYTNNSIEAGERVKTLLKTNLSDIAFEYQGSVMTNTHIKGHSDIDLVTITDKFYSYDNSRVSEIITNLSSNNEFSALSIEKLRKEYNQDKYKGDSLLDLKNLRFECEKILSHNYTYCDINQPKSIKVENRGLKRNIDVVIANWYDDVRSIINDKGKYRGIQIYNKALHRKENPDYPLISIDRINERGKQTNGRLKKMIRFLKNIKAESGEKIDLSSFDINAICYDIEVIKYIELPFYDLVTILYNQLKSICTNEGHANRLVSVDEREYIFRGQPDKLNNVKKVLQEVERIYLDLFSQLRK